MILTPDTYPQCIDFMSRRASRVNQITRKIFKLLGINNFILSNIENKNKNGLAALSANTDMLLPPYWVEQGMPLPLALPNGFYFVSQFSELFSPESLTTLREKYAIDHILFYVQHNHDSTDIFGLSADPDNKGVLNNYINHSQTLRKFFLYFKQETKTLLKEAQQNSFDYDFNIKLQKKSLPDKFHVPNYNGFSSLHDIANTLSKRELQCLESMASAMSIKSIAKKLKLSPKTVESYLINVKNKLNCTNRVEVLDLYHALNNEAGELL